MRFYNTEHVKAGGTYSADEISESVHHHLGRIIKQALEEHEGKLTVTMTEQDYKIQYRLALALILEYIERVSDVNIKQDKFVIIREFTKLVNRRFKNQLINTTDVENKRIRLVFGEEMSLSASDGWKLTIT